MSLRKSETLGRWTLLDTFCLHFWAWLLNTVAITPKSEDKKCPKVFNVPEFHFSEVYFFQNWYFREITRLDITMQPLIQDIFSQIIDSSPYFPKRFCDFSCMRFPFKTKQNVLSHANIFRSEIDKKCQNWFWMFEAYLEWNFCNFEHTTFVDLI